MFSPLLITLLSEVFLDDIYTSVCLKVVQHAEEEQRSEGNIDLRMYVKLFRAGANFLVLLVLILLNALAQVSPFFHNSMSSISFEISKHI